MNESKYGELSTIYKLQIKNKYSILICKGNVIFIDLQPL